MSQILKKQREQILRERILKAKAESGISYKFFVQLLDHKAYAISLFLQNKKGLHIDRIEKLEEFFRIKKPKDKVSKKKV